MKKMIKKFTVLSLIAAMVLGMCACGKSGDDTDSATKETEAKTNVWVEEDGKQYYYGEDGEIVTGRFVLSDEQKIYYTDDDGAVVRTVDGSQPMVAITYDDGPSQYTEDFVEIFNKYDSAATFFEVGERIDLFNLEDAEKAIADSYCELASHTFNHLNIRNLSKKKWKKQLSKNDDILKEMGADTDPIAFRAPEGAYSDEVLDNIDRAIVLWSVDTMDWKYRKAKKVYKKATKKIQDGDIILMHSLYESTLEASKDIVPELIDQGFQLVSIQDLAEFRGGLEAGEVYYSIPPLSEEEEAAESSEAVEETSGDEGEN